MLGAVLTQRTSWTNVERALDRIEAAWGGDGLTSPEIVRAAGEEELAQLVRPAGHYTSKPRRLRLLAEFVLSAGGIDALRASPLPTEELSARLLHLWGIGPETADAILLYALGRPVFVADAYALRLASRWGLLSPTARYAEIQRLFMENLPHDAALFNEYHALIVTHGKTLCRPRPRCELCPLARPLHIATGQTWRCPVPGQMSAAGGLPTQV
jgi:endonuclease-3 related protein